MIRLVERKILQLTQKEKGMKNLSFKTFSFLQISQIKALEEEINQKKSETCSEPSLLNMSMLDQSYTQVNDMKKREVKLQKVLESYETTFRQQAQDLESYKTKIKLLEEKTHFEGVARDLEIKLGKLKNEAEEKEVMHNFQMNLLNNRLTMAMSACDSANRLKDEAFRVKLDTEEKLAEITSKVQLAEDDSALNLESVVRLTEKLGEYHKKEDDWNERIERKMEETSKLEKAYKTLEEKYEKVSADNHRLAGHQNLKQKIQYITEMKKDLQLLKEENQKLVAENQVFRTSAATRKPLTVKNVDTRPVKT